MLAVQKARRIARSRNRRAAERIGRQANSDASRARRIARSRNRRAAERIGRQANSDVPKKASSTGGVREFEKTIRQRLE